MACRMLDSSGRRAGIAGIIRLRQGHFKASKLRAGGGGHVGFRDKSSCVLSEPHLTRLCFSKTVFSQFIHGGKQPNGSTDKELNTRMKL